MDTPMTGTLAQKLSGRKLITFRMIYHDGQTFHRGPTTDLLIYPSDATDTVVCRILKAFAMPGTSFALMQFTAPYPYGKRIVPNYFGIHDLQEIFVHVRNEFREGLDVVVAGMKRLGLATEDDAMHDVKRLRFDSLKIHDE